jgi:two-component system chemotaxis sensor kinase CheA
VQYRDRILPLVALRTVLEPGAAGPEEPADPVQVVVFNDGNSSVGMVVDEILDVTEEAVTVRQGSDRRGLLGSAVVGKQVTDFLDLNEVIRATGSSWYEGRDRHLRGQVLVADGSPFSRALVRSGLEMASYVVLEAANQEQAIAQLEQQPVNVVLAALELPPGGSSALLAAMRLRAEWDKIPVVVLAGSADMGVEAEAARTAGFEDCQPKFDRSLVLDSVAKLLTPAASFAAAPLQAEVKR